MLPALDVPGQDDVLPGGGQVRLGQGGVGRGGAAVERAATLAVHARDQD